MKKAYIDYEWGVEVPIVFDDGSYWTKADVEKFNFDIGLKKMILLWAFAVQNELNWHNPEDDEIYLPDYYFVFLQRLEKDIIALLQNYDIDLIKK